MRRKRISELCNRLSVEPDSQKIVQIVEELNQLVTEEHGRIVDELDAMNKVAAQCVKAARRCLAETQA